MDALPTMQKACDSIPALFRLQIAEKNLRTTGSHSQMSRLKKLFDDESVQQAVEQKVQATEQLPERKPRNPSLDETQTKYIKGECTHKECYGNSRCKRAKSYNGIDY